MANVQRYFDAFHRNIRLSLDENRTLREKRDIVCDKLADRLPQIFEAAGEDCPSFGFRDQGSYQMKTGTFPLTAILTSIWGCISRSIPTIISQWN